eukprot:764339-Hanusia_phi.AAC.2
MRVVHSRVGSRGGLDTSVRHLLATITCFAEPRSYSLSRTVVPEVVRDAVQGEVQRQPRAEVCHEGVDERLCAAFHPLVWASWFGPCAPSFLLSVDNHLGAPHAQYRLMNMVDISVE